MAVCFDFDVEGIIYTFLKGGTGFSENTGGTMEKTNMANPLKILT